MSKKVNDRDLDRQCSAARPGRTGHAPATRLESLQFLDCARESGTLGIADVELIPAGEVATYPPPEEDFHTHAKAFEQSGGADHVLRNRGLASVVLRATLLESSDELI